MIGARPIPRDEVRSAVPKVTVGQENGNRALLDFVGG
jgi:hypothetical protein